MVLLTEVSNKNLIIINNLHLNHKNIMYVEIMKSDKTNVSKIVSLFISCKFNFIRKFVITYFFNSLFCIKYAKNQMCHSYNNFKLPNYRLNKENL